jgi:uncharacterized protein (DUF2141 family)
MIPLLVLILNSGTALLQDRDDTVVVVDLTDLRSREGKILISIYDDPETFPDDEKMLEQKILKNITGETMRIRFEQLTSGTYAIAAMHDENGDEQMNFNLLGMPKEGYCFSNNVRPKLRRPHWDEAKFEVGKQDTLIRIEMKY